jgi:hypothetical protein
MKKQKGLKDLRNVGKAVLRDLTLLDIDSIETLALQDATELFQKLEKISKARQDPCVWDVFAAIIYEAKTGEKTNWWAWTSKRKTLQRSGKVKHVV